MIYLINAESTATKTNTGMKTVDIAWDIFLEKNNIKIPYKRFSIKAKEQNIKVTDKISLQYDGSLNFDLDMLNKDDILVYWGDFLHSHHYLTNDLFRITKKRRRDINTYIPKFLKNKKLQEFYENDYLNLTYRFYLLKGIEKKHWKGTISFGTTLVGDNDIELFKEKDYLNSFNKFIQNLDYIWTRDVHSALQASHVRKDYSQSYLGVDAALLIGSEDYDKILDEPNVDIPKEDYIITHFTRTQASIDKLLGLADGISEELNMPLYWLPWLTRFDDNKFDNMDKKLREKVSQVDAVSYSDLIHFLRNASLVVTDTYHLALVAWRLRVPVLCIGLGLQYPTSSVHDKKKEIFYTMHNMLPLYFYAELLDDSEQTAEYIKLIKTKLEKKDALENIFDKIENQAKSVEKDLVNYFHLKLKMN